MPGIHVVSIRHILHGFTHVECTEQGQRQRQEVDWWPLGAGRRFSSLEHLHCFLRHVSPLCPFQPPSSPLDSRFCIFVHGASSSKVLWSLCMSLTILFILQDLAVMPPPSKSRSVNLISSTQASIITPLPTLSLELQLTMWTPDSTMRLTADIIESHLFSSPWLFLVYRSFLFQKSVSSWRPWSTAPFKTTSSEKLNINILHVNVSHTIIFIMYVKVPFSFRPLNTQRPPAPSRIRRKHSTPCAPPSPSLSVCQRWALP